MDETLSELPLASLCRRVARTVARDARGELDRAGFGDVAPAHNAVLLPLMRSALRPGQISDKTGLFKQAVSLMVNALEAGGY